MKIEKSQIKLLWGNEDACSHCGFVIYGHHPSDCGDPHPNCPVFGIGQEAYDQMAKDLDNQRRFEEELKLPEGFRFLEI